MRITRVGRYLHIHCSTAHYPNLRTLPGFKRELEKGLIKAEPSRANLEHLLENFPAAKWESEDYLRIQKLESLEKSSIEEYNEFDFDFKLPPYQHQIEAFYRSADMPGFAYFMEMGTGKTKVLIDNIAYLWLKGKIEGALILAPNGVHEQFIEEQLEIHMPNFCDYISFSHASGGKVAWRKKYESFMDYKGPWCKILAINIEALSHNSGLQKGSQFLKSFDGRRKKVLIAVDESTRIKSRSSIRTKNAFKLRAPCSYARILSGSPITRGVEDLFNQFKFLSPNILGYTSYYTFKNRYCVVEQENHFVKTRKGALKEVEVEHIQDYKNMDELKRKVLPWCHRATKDECLDLPPKIYKNRFVPISDEQRKAYRELAREMEIELNGQYLSAAMAIVRLTKLQQILCGFLRMGDEKDYIFKKNPRLIAAQEWVEEAQGQVVIWARFTRDIDLLCEAFPGDHVRYDGKVNKTERKKAKEDFLAENKRIFIGKPASGGLGLNWLVGAHDVLYFSNSFDAEHRWQSEDRNHRMGTKKTVTYTDLVVPKSIDTYILTALRSKKDIATMVTEDIRDLLREVILRAKTL